MKALEILARTEPRSMYAENPPVAWDRAEGFLVWDGDGNQWIDLAAGIACANGGHGHPSVVAAMKATLERPLAYGYLYPTLERARAISKLLATLPGFERVLFYSAGTEAVEVTIKLARLRGRPKGREEIVAFEAAFHGKTAGTALLADRDIIRGWFGWNDPRIHHVQFPFNPIGPASTFADTLRTLDARGVRVDKIAAFIVEPFQGWSSALMPRDYAQALRAWASANDVLLVVDEIQSGFGRSGTMYAYQQLGIQPDLLTLGKGLSGGFPISAIVGTTEILDVDPVTNSTHSGNPVGCAAIEATLDVFERHRLIEGLPPLEAILLARLTALQQAMPQNVRWVHGTGMSWSIFCQDAASGQPLPALAQQVLNEAYTRGVLISRYGLTPIVKLAPPLVITPAALDEALGALHEAFEAAVAAR